MDELNTVIEPYVELNNLKSFVAKLKKKLNLKKSASLEDVLLKVDCLLRSEDDLK